VSVAAFPGVRSPIGTWWLRSIRIDGGELLDGPLDLWLGNNDAVVTLAEQASELSGDVKDAAGAAMQDVYVIAFSADRAHWFFNSRRVASVRSDRQGRHTIRNLPPGEYRAVAVNDTDQGEWFDPAVLERLQGKAVPITIVGVERKTVDLVIR
jgi:hypothetical protein